jgi:hypothetical protein
MLAKIKKLLRPRHRLLKLAYFVSLRFGFPIFPFFCPVCEKPVRRWLPFERDIGHGKKRLEPEERLCPHCKSFERTRHFSLYLLKTSDLEHRPRFLHFAPEPGLEPKFRSQLGDRYVTPDLFKPNVDSRQDITKMTFGDNSFDFIYCSNVLEHVENDVAAMRELLRVLIPGGVAIVQVPIMGDVTKEDISITDPAERTIHFGQADHVRYYGRDIKDRLTHAGFVVDEFYMLDVLNLSPSEVQRMNLNKRELIHRCVKPGYAS